MGTGGGSNVKIAFDQRFVESSVPTASMCSHEVYRCGVSFGQRHTPCRRAESVKMMYNSDPITQIL